MNETQFKTKVEKFLEEEKCWYIKYWGGGGFTKSGIPDILACCKGHFFGIELKVHPNKPSKLQEHVLTNIDDAGGVAIVLYPEDFEEFKKLVRELKHTSTIRTAHEPFLYN